MMTGIDVPRYSNPQSVLYTLIVASLLSKVMKNVNCAKYLFFCSSCDCFYTCGVRSICYQKFRSNWCVPWHFVSHLLIVVPSPILQVSEIFFWKSSSQTALPFNWKKMVGIKRSKCHVLRSCPAAYLPVFPHTNSNRLFTLLAYA